MRSGPKAARILKATPENIRSAAEAIRRGELVAMPTETVYGLAGAAFQERALSRIFATKERPTFDPLILHVLAQDLASLESVGIVDGSQLQAPARRIVELLIRAFWPGPLTLVLPKQAQVPDLATSGLPTVAVRMPGHPAARALIRAAGTPLAAPSANRFGRISPTTASHVKEELGDRIEWILDGGSCEVGLESTVIQVDTETGALTLLRPGAVSTDAIQGASGAPVGRPRASAGAHTLAAPAPAPGPGMLASHYAPGKPLHLLPGSISTLPPESLSSLRGLCERHARAGLLLQSGAPESGAALAARLFGGGCRFNALSLSVSGDLEEAARNLFARLRELDGSDAEILFAEPHPSETGLAHAINDRLRRASGSGSLPPTAPGA